MKLRCVFLSGGINMHMETDRLVIREFAMEDLQDLYEILGDEETMAN